MQTTMNGFGSDATAASGAADKIKGITQFSIFALSGAIGIFTGQNIGADRRDRVRNGLKYGMYIGITLGVIVSAFSLLFGRQMIMWFIPAHETAVIEIGWSYFTTVGCLYFILAILNVFWGIIAGAGGLVFTSVLSFVCFVLVQGQATIYLARVTGDATKVWWAILMGWVVGIAMQIVYYCKANWYQRARQRLLAPKA